MARKWIRCLEEMPQEIPGKQYLITLNDGRMAVAEVSYPYQNEKYALWIGAGELEWDGSEVSHWSQLPEGPKKPYTKYTKYTAGRGAK